LIANLDKQGINIISSYSTKTVKYFQNISFSASSVLQEEEVTVPLATQFPQDIETSQIEFNLRSPSAGLELKLRNYDVVTDRPTKGVIGGPFAGNFGIIGRLVVKGKNLDLGIVDKVEQDLKATY